MAPTFPYAHMTPDRVRALHGTDRILYIEHCAELPIYYYENTEMFSVVVPGAYEIIDQAKADADMAALETCSTRMRQLSRARGHGAAVATKLETVAQRMGSEPPPVPADLPEHPIPRGSMTHIPMDAAYVIPMIALYDEPTNHLWLMGTTAYTRDPYLVHELRQLRLAMQTMLQLDADRKADGVRGAQELLTWLDGRSYGSPPS